eukprot:Skav205104  [mRNA]  locus=scaffold2918:25718:26515:- [translate_table: standard]
MNRLWRSTICFDLLHLGVPLAEKSKFHRCSAAGYPVPPPVIVRRPRLTAVHLTVSGVASQWQIMASVPVADLSKEQQDELLCTYAALILHDDGAETGKRNPGRQRVTPNLGSEW